MADLKMMTGQQIGEQVAKTLRPKLPKFSRGKVAARNYYREITDSLFDELCKDLPVNSEDQAP